MDELVDNIATIPKKLKIKKFKKKKVLAIVEVYYVRNWRKLKSIKF